MQGRYPIRFSSKGWFINFFTSSSRGYIHLSSFKKYNPKCITNSQDIFYLNPLENAEELVIPDQEVKVVIDFPVSHKAEATISSKNPEGFLLKDLLHQIKRIYKYIYREEERTATSYVHTLSKFCDICVYSIFNNEHTKKCSAPPEDSCTICLDAFGGDECHSLECEHKFHKKCIDDWFEYSSNCPLCRQNCIRCNICNGTCIIHYNYEGKVIPVEKRGLMRFRNSTDGIFGIFNYDFEDIVLKSMFYDRHDRCVNLEF